MTYRSISVLTLVRGRQVHLEHLIAGLQSQERIPDEVIIAYMQDEPPKVPDDGLLRIRLIHVGGEPMPLAKARNRAADAAEGSILAFLDVDCIPDSQFVKRAVESMEHERNGVFLPEVRYLPARSGDWLCTSQQAPDYSVLDELGLRHPAKPDLTGISIEPIGDFGELWGLAFILTAGLWHDAGGMNEDYNGYGAEETDFGKRLELAGAVLHWLGGTVCYHQHHTVHKPPLQHFESIVRNARQFYSQWGEWCMDYWLDDFVRRGLLSRSNSEITIIRTPTAVEVEGTRQGPNVRFS